MLRWQSGLDKESCLISIPTKCGLQILTSMMIWHFNNGQPSEQQQKFSKIKREHQNDVGYWNSKREKRNLWKIDQNVFLLM